MIDRYAALAARMVGRALVVAALFAAAGLCSSSLRAQEPSEPAEREHQQAEEGHADEEGLADDGVGREPAGLTRAEYDTGIQQLRQDLLEIERRQLTNLLEIATLYVGGVAILLTVVIAAFGWVLMVRYQDLMARINKHSEEFRLGRESVSEAIAGFEKDVTAQRESIVATQEFLARAWDTFSDSQVEFVSSLRSSDVISDSEDQALRAKIVEAEARLLLGHPDPATVERGIYRLKGLGSASSIPDLSAVQDDEEHSAQTRLLAQAAVTAIRQRMGEGPKE